MFGRDYMNQEWAIIKKKLSKIERHYQLQLPKRKIDPS